MALTPYFHKNVAMEEQFHRFEAGISLNRIFAKGAVHFPKFTNFAKKNTGLQKDADRCKARSDGESQQTTEKSWIAKASNLSEQREQSTESLMAKSKTVAFVIFTVLSLQLAGFLDQGLREGVGLAHFCVAQGWVSQAAFIALNHFLIGVVATSLLWAFFAWNPWPFWILGIIFALEAATVAWMGKSFADFMMPLTEAVRYLWLFAVGAALYISVHDDEPHCAAKLSRWLRMALAISCAAHGVEALWAAPEFVRLVVIANERWLPFPPTENFAQQALLVIGSIDLIVALLLVSFPKPAILLYVGAWGVVTAASRIFLHPGAHGWFEACLRASLYGLPFLLWSMGEQTPTPSDRVKWGKRGVRTRNPA